MTPPPPSAIQQPVAVTDTTGVTIPKPTTLPNKINDRYYRRRTEDNNGPWGTAAPSSSALFKSPEENSADKPLAKRWDSFFSQETLARKPSTLKAAARFLSKPGIISLGGGLPASDYFPFSSFGATVPSGKMGEFDEASTNKTGVAITSGKHDLTEGKAIFDIATAFNYGQGTGSSQLVRYVTEHMELVHNPAYKDWACNLTIGSTSALDLSLRMFTERGDAVMTECYTFPTALETLGPLGLKAIGLKMDEQGVIPELLEEILENWDEKTRGAKRPRVLYIIPTGQNPSGATMGLQRKKTIYSICQKYNVFILEDEPYFFLQMPDYDPNAASKDESTVTHEGFLKSLIPSFLTIDVDGRVLRMDSFSKVLAPGSRLGWVTASQQVIDMYRMHVDCCTQGPSGMSQLLIFKLLDEHWGHGGFLDWLKYIRKEYTIRRDVIVKACETHLPREIVSWVPPKAGMFHWLKVDWRKHPRVSSMTMDEIEEQVFMTTIEEGALVTRGSWFLANPESDQEYMFFRATYAAAPADKIEAAIARFGEGLRKAFELTPAMNGMTNGKH